MLESSVNRIVQPPTPVNKMQSFGPMQQPTPVRVSQPININDRWSAGIPLTPHKNNFMNERQTLIRSLS